MTLTLTNPEKHRGWLYLLLQMLVIPWIAATVCAALSLPSNTAANLVAFYLNGILALVFFRELLMRSCQGVRWGRMAGTVAMGFGLYWLTNLLMLALIRAVQPDYANINDPSVNAMIDEAPLLMAVAVVFAAPLAEECLFRGWIFTGLAKKSLPMAYAVTALFFSAAHIAPYLGIFSPVTLFLCFLQYLGPSIALCWTCRRADSLLAPMLLHMLINTIALFATR